MTVFGYPPPNPYHDIKEHTMTAHFRKYTDNAGEFRWSLKGANGEVIATSESYTRANDRDRSIDDLKRIMAELAVNETWPPSSGGSVIVIDPDCIPDPADHQAARQEFTRRATDRDDTPDDAA